MAMETRTTLNDQIVDQLQDLIALNIDSSKGFRAAADVIESQAVATLFRQCAVERETQATELQGLVGMNGERPKDSGTAKGALHRWWLEARGKVQQGDEHAVLAEAERGEDAIKQRYEEVLKGNPGTAVNDLLQRQYAAVKRRHDQVRDLRDRAA